MRRFTSVFGLLLAMLAASISLKAESSSIFNAEHNPVATASQVSQSLYGGSEMTRVFTNVPLKAEAAKAPSVNVSRKARTKSVSTIADLKGDYVMTFKSLTTSVANGGLAAVVEPVPDTDSIMITNFWSSGLKVKAKVDLVSMKLTIPNQVLGTNSNYGDFDIAFCTSTGKPDRAAELEGTIGADGTISIDSWWGIFIVSGTYKDQFFGAYYGTELEKANAKMSQTVWSSSANALVTLSYAVIVEQPAVNVLTVKNFADYGQTVEIDLKRDMTAEIPSQVARLDATNGNWSTVHAVYDENYKFTGYSSTIVCDQAVDKRTITWKDWTLLTTGYYAGICTLGKIEVPFDIEYPTLSVTDFEGEGTEASPYLIKTRDDLILLAEKVNSVTEFPYGTTTKYARVFMNTYFRMENDIDMAGYRFEPIANGWNYHFAGVFDGGNHTIKNLEVSTGAGGYAGLFGKCDTISVVKNLVMENPNITSGSYYAAAVAGHSIGVIDNCHVKNGYIYNSGNTGAAGIAAIGTVVTNCTVENTRIIGAGGYCGGVAGQINELISNSSANAVYILAGGLGDMYPSGGVVGSLYGGKAVNCYSSAIVNGQTVSNLALGGVAGVCYKGSIEKCFNAGDVLAYNNGAAVGGVVGVLYGTLTDSYNTGSVSGYSSRMSGGITGSVRYWTDDFGTVCQSVIKSCYTAGTHTAETYQYNPETERRETLGQVFEGANPTVENIYYDKQIVDFKSAEYGALTKTLTSGAGVAGLSADTWTFTEGFYPRLKGIDDNAAARFGATTIYMDENSSISKLARDAELHLMNGVKAAYLTGGNTVVANGIYSSIVDGKLKLKENFGTDTLFVYADGQINSVYRTYLIKVSPVPFDGAGTEENPYLIKTKADLITLSKVTNGVKQYFPDTYFKMTNDIDLEYDAEFKGLCTDAADAHCQFTGHFDGAGFAIHKMMLKGVVWEIEPTEDQLGTPKTGSGDVSVGYTGFIGRLAPEGTLRNLTIAADCDLSQIWASAAALVGYNYGKVMNCRNHADVTGYSCWIGGIVGQNNKGAEVHDCLNTGSIISGYFQAGGITGSNYGLIENSQNTGYVAVKKISTFPSKPNFNLAGGITGGLTGGRVKNCVNAGTIEASTKAGGISGSIAAVTGTSYDYYNDVINCINYGSVFCDDKVNVGAIGGCAGTTGILADNYYDGQISMFNANGNESLDGTQAVETSFLTSGNAIENYSTDLWSFAAGQYPVLKQFADVEAVKLSRSVVAKAASGETVAALKSDVALSTANDCSWKLADGSVFSIADGKLVVPASVEEVVVDTLVATAGSYVKPIAVQAVPRIPLVGEGTEESPYLINNAAEWNALADFMAKTSNSLEGKFVKLAADIDFTDAVFKPLAYDRVTVLNADLNGDGKTVKGIKATADAKFYGAIVMAGESANIHDLTIEGEIAGGTKLNNIAGVVGKLQGKLVNVVNKASVTNTVSYTAGVVGYAATGAELVNCVNEGEITSSSTYTAGLVAQSEAGVKYIDCGNKGTVTYTGTTAKSYTAGLIAIAYSDSLYRCYNSGAVVAKTPASAGGFAGLIAMANSTKDAPAYYLEDCYNSADISSLADNAGLIAYVNTSGYTTMHLEGCYNTGNISSVSTTAKSSTYTAGLVAQYTPNSIYRGCSNSGAVTSVKSVYVGGVLCYYKGSFTEATRTYVIDCHNSGHVVASGNQGAGIVASISNYVTVDSCSNSGVIEGGFGLGGIVANLSGKASVVSNCWNTGDVNTTMNRAGGIIGYNSVQATVSNCFNTGNISSTNADAKNGYGIGGIAGQGGSIFTNVYSTGTVKGLARVGGLIGYPNKGTTQISKAYFSGKVDAPADTCGMIIGVNMIDNGKVWNATNSVAETYFLKENKVECVDTISAALSVAELAMLDLGEAWTSADDYSFPVLRGLDNLDCAKINSAAVVLADGDTPASVKQTVHVGTPDGVLWTSSAPEVVIEGNVVKIMADKFSGNVTLTATCGDYAKSVDLKFDEAVGVGSAIAGKAVVDEKFYNAAGVEVAKPLNGEKTLYIVVKTYDDGTTAVVKEVR